MSGPLRRDSHLSLVALFSICRFRLQPDPGARLCASAVAKAVLQQRPLGTTLADTGGGRGTSKRARHNLKSIVRLREPVSEPVTNSSDLLIDAGLSVSCSPD